MNACVVAPVAVAIIHTYACCTEEERKRIDALIALTFQRVDASNVIVEQHSADDLLDIVCPDPETIQSIA